MNNDDLIIREDGLDIFERTLKKVSRSEYEYRYFDDTEVFNVNDLTITRDIGILYSQAHEAGYFCTGLELWVLPEIAFKLYIKGILTTAMFENADVGRDTILIESVNFGSVYSTDAGYKPVKGPVRIFDDPLALADENDWDITSYMLHPFGYPEGTNYLEYPFFIDYATEPFEEYYEYQYIVWN
jgi:hypothetical protein